MYILDKLILLTIFKKCCSYNYNHFYKMNSIKINNLDDKNSGLDMRYNKNDIFDEYYFNTIFKKKKLMEKLKSNDISEIEKINLINEAKINGILENKGISINILSGGLLDDYEFKI